MAQEFATDLITKGTAAFAGAFFAFLFVRLGEALTQYHKRAQLHYNSLIKLQHVGNRYLSLLSENRFELDQITSIVERRRADLAAGGAVLPLPMNRPQAIPLDEAVIHGFTNLDLINELAMYHEDLRKLGRSFETLNRSFELFRDAFLNGRVSRETYLANLDYYVRDGNETKAFVADLERRTKRLVAIARCLATTDAPLFDRVLRWCVAEKRYRPGFERRVTQEIAKLESEIAEGSTRDAERIQRLVSRAGANRRET